MGWQPFFLLALPTQRECTQRLWAAPPLRPSAVESGPSGAKGQPEVYMSSFRRTRIRRGIAWVNAIAFTSSFVLTSPLQGLAQSGPARRAVSAPRPAHMAKVLPPPKSLRENLRPLTAEQIRYRTAHPAPAHVIPTVLDEAGRLARNVPETEAAQWRASLHQPGATSYAASVTNIRLGEYQLAHDENPEGALWHFRAASSLAVSALHRQGPRVEWQTVKSLAAYDTALTHLLQGRYAEASGDFRSLFARSDLQGGFVSRNAALLRRHADACSGYHQERRKAGITEPVRLDPDCGAAALAACLRAHHLPFGKEAVTAAVPMTGFGSSLSDIAKGAKRLEMSAHRVTADDAALKALPKPLAAFVEHDHFIAVTSADRAGVSYLCSDCGVWPGGHRHVTWRQWRMMEASEYLAVVEPGGAADRALAGLPASANKPTATAAVPGARHALAPATAPSHGLRLASDLGSVAASAARLSTRLRGHALLLPPEETARCGFRIGSVKCTPNILCPMDGCAVCGKKGPSEGDPVNLATLEEEYSPAADLVVYNPVGPSVVWSRTYNSFGNGKVKNTAGTYGPEPSQDFGVGWSQPYDLGIFSPGTTNSDGSANEYLTMPNGAQVHFNSGMPPEN
jgi:hypothetical protein